MKISLTRELLLASTIVAGLGFTAPAFAQSAGSTPNNSANEKAAEVVVVTGTRIQTPGTTSSSPITSVGAAELEFQQSSEIEKVLRNLPLAVPGDGGNTNNGTAGVTTINLRDLGPQRNLVMVDGKRVTPYNINGIVDISIIPAAMLDRVDIVTGGASAVYGSDAISGAVNFVLKRNFEGVEVNYEHTRAGKDDGRISNGSIALGVNTPDQKGNIAIAMNFTKRDGVQFGDRPFGTLGINSESGDGLSSIGVKVTPPTNCTGDNTVPPSFGGSGTTVPARINALPTSSKFKTGNLQFRDDGTLGANCNTFNFNPYNYYQTPQERYSGVAYGHYGISENLEAYGRLMFGAVNVRQQIAPSGVFNSPFLVPLNNPFLSKAARDNLIERYQAGLTPVAPTADIPEPEPQTVLGKNWLDNNNNGIVDAADTVRFGIARRTTELGVRSTTFDNNMFQLMFGLRGTFAESWDWDVSLLHGESDRTNLSSGFTNIAKLAASLNTVSATKCTTPAGVTTAGCVPINLFGKQGTITKEMADYLRVDALEKQNYKQTVANASISGPFTAAQSPWADTPLQVALGTEYREEFGSVSPDDCLKGSNGVSCLGGGGGNTLPVSGAFSVQEFFGEAIMPLASGKPIFESLELELGVRYSDFNLTGANTTWKAGFNWGIFDSVRARVMRQRAVRAPSINELFAPLTSSLDNAAGDPCSVGAKSISDSVRALCIATGMTSSQVGTVPDIVAGQINTFSGTLPTALPDPEVANTWTAGLVFTPQVSGLKNMIVSLDYYKIDIDGYINTLGPQEVLDLCYKQGNKAYCNQIKRVDGNLIFPGSGIQLYNQNLDYYASEGYDLGASFAFDLETLGLDSKWGTVSLSYNATFTIRNASLSSSASSEIDCLGKYGNQCGNPSPKYKHVARTTWKVGDARVSSLWRRVGETTVEEVQKADTFDDFEKIKAYDYIDLFVSYDLTSALNISLSVNNALNKNPPLVGGDIGTTSSNGGNTFPQTYDTLGRVYTVGFNLKF
ncbi:TonB-dependent receptor domain-containing protein [Candidatus Phycosocius spiralis]|uniref:TonB-dependent receptor n=1 Tax=Candidatus Phycosocius spiralis TaxID=2815099 RepID=A0ABQ4PV32_9PROT|nr:TonB-dependent receptor [Candidatus Phycosocius spiralis]GIU66887.1 TonB-dependent receptor [Candidatus Phycosocius spiralis]